MTKNTHKHTTNTVNLIVKSIAENYSRNIKIVFFSFFFCYSIHLFYFFVLKELLVLVPNDS
jgi:hypothetical protein